MIIYWHVNAFYRYVLSAGQLPVKVVHIKSSAKGEGAPAGALPKFLADFSGDTQMKYLS